MFQASTGTSGATNASSNPLQSHVGYAESNARYWDAIPLIRNQLRRSSFRLYCTR
ncbi:hypothetical protein SBC1_78130 (plasmid) [Caballeronia sp. SBC1]|nr:hypothetical protein SBC2_75890 [Caballeronia sp. SBC2]QIN67766.1 hypothetical protein SBC1_78130 [Caballeronia sp. SBC1]